MKNLALPFDKAFIERVTKNHPTPFHIYDEAAIRANARAMYQAFSWVPDATGKPGGFKNYYAVKALPNPHILKVLHEEGMGFDCSSVAELIMCEKLGYTGEEIIFTSNDTPIYEYQKAKDLGGIINLDDITHVDYVANGVGMPELICMRYNPGPLREGNVIIGKPEEAKYGFTREQIIAGYTAARDRGARRFGLHTMVASNELNPDYFVETAVMLFELAVEIKEKTGIRVEFVNLGGGIGIPYRPEQTAVDYQYVSDGVRAAYERIVKPAGLDPLRIVLENGRVVTGPYGYLVTRAIHRKDTYKHYIGLDGNMANLMRPGMYGAYHHITVLGKEEAAANHTYDIVGSLCENNDKFAIDRSLPAVDIDDIVVIHDTGAHGHSMGFNYNGKLRSAELLLRPDRTVQQIRRAETLDDHFATLDFAAV
ncbi:MAG: diaminopimelate decarboxylase [Spirochaetaceae bacterium]|nr:MAG: diaminopimelate decarboxylase [Spirochaetaceae bacterium]